MVAAARDPEGVGGAVGLVLIGLGPRELPGGLEVGLGAVEPPQGDPAVPAVAKEAVMEAEKAVVATVEVAMEEAMAAAVMAVMGAAETAVVTAEAETEAVTVAPR